MQVRALFSYAIAHLNTLALHHCLCIAVFFLSNSRMEPDWWAALGRILWQYNKLFYKEKRICNRMFGFQKIVSLYTQPGPIWWTNYVNPGRTLHHSHASRPPSSETLYDRVTKVQSYNLGSQVNQHPPVHHEDEFLLYLAYLPTYLLAPTEQQTTQPHLHADLPIDL
jgi:hypothetical protein